MRAGTQVELRPSLFALAYPLTRLPLLRPHLRQVHAAEAAGIQCRGSARHVPANLLVGLRVHHGALLTLASHHRDSIIASDRPIYGSRSNGVSAILRGNLGFAIRSNRSFARGTTPVPAGGPGRAHIPLHFRGVPGGTNPPVFSIFTGPASRNRSIP